jgi:anti-sigma factor RsiW
MNRRDLELLSSYLDGQLGLSDSARLERRLSSDPDLRAVLEDLRAARGVLRKLPMRKAPRNFTLTPKMVGKNPPLPRTYPAFRFVTALATLLLVFTVGFNALAPQLASAPMYGMGGGGAPEVLSAQAPAATESAAAAAAATQAPAAEMPAATEPPAGLAAPLATATAAAQDTARTAETPSQKEGVTGQGGGVAVQNQPPVPASAPQPVPPLLEVSLAGIAALGGAVMVLMRRLAADRWRGK